jgi:hypothetical protein
MFDQGDRDSQSLPPELPACVAQLSSTFDRI